LNKEVTRYKTKKSNNCFTFTFIDLSAEEDSLQVVAPTATKAANDPQFFPYPPKEGWWAVVMALKLDNYGPPGS